MSNEQVPLEIADILADVDRVANNESILALHSLILKTASLALSTVSSVQWEVISSFSGCGKKSHFHPFPELFL